ncbi:MAG: EI24 domain-containing protein [Paracoccaceae bacterium]|nr:EI24 domain-containing protein [Paracoccaceae bacterium]MDG2259632.1 EI24 domain-containing protein [Paracoccaceae bacterium]
MIFSSFSKAVAQISDPRFRRVFYLGIGLTFALLVAAFAAFLLILNWMFGEEVILPLVGEVTWLNDLLSWSSFFVMVLFSTFLMIPVASAITSIFLEDVAQAVEDKHYPHLPSASGVGIWTAIKDSINFMGVIILANTLALVLYVFFPLFAPLIFWSLNGYLLGREYFQLAAMRRVGIKKAKQLRSKHAGKIWLAGTLMAIPLSIPLLNLVIPILGAATFTHIYHRVTGQRS